MEITQGMRTTGGRTVAELSYERPVLLVFLRHFGCTFCREALDDLSRQRERIEEAGATLVMVHMADGATAERYFSKYDLGGILHVSDPTSRFYRAFGLKKGTARQLFGLRSWIRGFEAGVVNGHGVGTELGDGFQMPGVFVLVDEQVKGEFVHDLASDRPRYLELVRTCCHV